MAMRVPPPVERAGLHLPWAEVPERVRRWANELAGIPVEAALDLHGGFSPGATARLRSARGREVFVKAVGVELNPDSPDIHRREAMVAGALPESSLWPRLVESYDDGTWVALAFEVIDGRPPATPWVPDVLDATVRALESLHAHLTPAPISVVAPASERLRDVLYGWRALAGAPESAARLDPWSARHLDRLVDLEASWPSATAGDTLLHCDIRSDNILVRSDGTVAFVDWPHAAVGAAFVDAVFWAPSVALEGGPDPEDLLSRHQPSRDADRDAVTVVLAAFAGFLISHSLRPDPPGLPTLRGFQAAQGEIARAWLEQRTGW